MLSQGPRLADHLARALRAAHDELARLPADTIVAENEDVLISDLVDKHIPSPVSISWESATRSVPSETTVGFPEAFNRNNVHIVPADAVTVRVPISGSAEILTMQASTFSMGGEPDCQIRDGWVIIEIVERDLTAQRVSERIAEVRRDLTKRSEWANSDVTGFRHRADIELREARARRRNQILRLRDLDAALPIPVTDTSTPRPPVPAQRKHVSLEQRRSQSAAGAVPEPHLDTAIYHDILDAVSHFMASFERTPQMAQNLGEEHFRDVLLANLNSYWQGQAGGELFNGAGKTDILIRHEGRNVFIAECKIWHGPKGVGRALDQLLSYTVWRDSKAALIMVIRDAADATAIIAKLHQAVREHPSFVMQAPAGRDEPARQVDYIFTADDAQRRVSVAVLPFVVAAP